MNQYVNHFQCSKNNDTGETVIQFLQISPNLVINKDGVSTDGIQAEIVSSIVMSEQNAKEFLNVLSSIIK